VRYIHQDPDWPRFRWRDPEILALLAEVRHRQGWLLGRMDGLGFRFRAEAGLENLTSEVVKSSAIEGTRFDAASVRSSIARRLGMARDEKASAGPEIEGAVDMVLDASQRYREPLTAERLLGWQASLFPGGFSGLRRVLVGRWRTAEMDPMQVVSGPIDRDRVRRKNIHFEAPPAERIPADVDAFLRWFESAEMLDPVLRAAIAHLWFVTIHPFEDGNGRVSRAIADLALARADGSALRFYSMSAQIEAEKGDYYRILEQTQKETMDITAWLLWFLECLRRALVRAERVLSVTLRKAAVWDRINTGIAVNERQRRVLNALLDEAVAETSTSRYAKLARCSLDTALRDLKALVECGALEPGEGGGRSTRYRIRGSPEPG
jgi:Fic family protein